MQFTSTFPSHGQMIQGSTLEGDTETQGFKRRETPSTREAQDEKCCREGLGMGGKGLHSQNRRKGRARNTPRAGCRLSHFLEELEEVIAIDWV